MMAAEVSHGETKILTQDRQVTRLGESVFRSGRISKEALAAAKLGGIGYHPSLLPRHRGIAAVEWTIREGDPIAGGTVYHLADRMDAGAIAAR